MSQLTVEKLDGEVIAGKFDCGNESINSMVSQSYFPTLLQHAYAYKVILSDCVIGYYMILFKTLELENAPEVVQEYRSSLIDTYTCVDIKYIAVEQSKQGNSYGTHILRSIMANVYTLSNDFPVSFITLDALKEKYEWYRKNGFLAFDEKEMNNSSPTIQMYVSCVLNQEAIETYVDDYLI